MTAPLWDLRLGKWQTALADIGEVDCVITDPPYSERTHAGARGSDRDGAKQVARAIVDFDSITTDALRDAFGAMRFRRWLVSFMDYTMVPWMEENPPAGMRGVRMGIWVKPNGAPQFTGDRPGQGWEAVWIAHRLGPDGEKPQMRWNGGGSHAVWTQAIERSEVSGHPTAKPLPLVKRLIELFTDEGETILDPFGGSGTTAVACRDLGRKCILIERDEKWCAVAKRRLAQNLLPLGGAA